MRRQLIIMQGAPGSGKSALAGAIAHTRQRMGYQVLIYSADDHFTDDEGEYYFDPSKLSEAHTLCRTRVNLAMTNDCPLIIVDNNNSRQWEAQPYIDMAKQFGYGIQVIRCDARFQNTHGVPDEKVAEIRRRMETLVF